MQSNIYILSQPIKTGKTTLLKNWVDKQNNIAGILTPDVNEVRMLYNIAEKTYHTLQVNTEENAIKIGRFLFDKNGFKLAKEILSQSIPSQHNWVIVDEVGRLEINEQSGLEPTLTNIINAYKNQKAKGNLLLVVRDYLLQDVLNYYQIPDAIILDKDFFKGEQPSKISNQNNLTGLVLCGGKSIRMGRDKAFIVYHNKPQYAHVCDMLNPFCDEVIISCNNTQKTQINQPYKYIADNSKFSDNGPITGVLSAFNQIKSSGLLVIGCDYPNLTQADIKKLIDAREKDVDVVCYKNTETNFEEPILAIYEEQCAKMLLNFYNSGQQSLRHFLNTVNTKTITPLNINNIKSVDF